MSCVVGVLGGCCPTIYPIGVQCICIFANGSGLAFGNRSMPYCYERFVSALPLAAQMGEGVGRDTQLLAAESFIPSDYAPDIDRVVV